MSSIWGIADFNNRSNIDISSLKAMSAALSVGSGGTNIYITSDAALGCGCFSGAGFGGCAQPVSAVFHQHIYTVVFSGTLTNQLQLRRNLIRCGAVFKTVCDAEVALYAYIIYGADCAAELCGSFSLCVYDEYRERLFLARDRSGSKPLFYTFSESTLLFSSEVKTLLAAPSIKRRVSSIETKSIENIFWDIFEVKAGSCGFFDESGLCLNKY